MFSAVSMAELLEGWISLSVSPTGGRMVAEKESGWNTFLIHSQPCNTPGSSVPVSFMPRIMEMVRSLPTVRMAANMMKSMGICISIGRQPDMGLTCSLRYSSLIFWLSLSRSLAYLACSAAIWGCMACMARMLFLLLMSRGRRIRRMIRVNTTMDQP